jgi:hypothetical protein
MNEDLGCSTHGMVKARAERTVAADRGRPIGLQGATAQRAAPAAELGC